MPMSEGFQARLLPLLKNAAEFFGTPFHIYDEAGIRATGAALKAAFAGISGFREYFAVKALPNPRILAIMREMDFGFDASSIPELILSRQVGAHGEDILFTSNNTSPEEFSAALSEGGCILNLDDISLIEKVPQMPDLISFRYNPGPRRSGNIIIGNPVEAKFGLTEAQLTPAYQQAKARGARRFGLHAMIVSNERDYRSMAQTAQMLLEQCVQLAGAGFSMEFINIGGGLGIPYRPEEAPLDIQALGAEISALFHDFPAPPRLYMESGRYMTGPHGVLVTRVINRKDTYRRFIGVDASMSAFMRPGMYGAYHHIDVAGKNRAEEGEVVDVVGSLCENNDKFAVQRSLPPIQTGDLLLIHDTGAHGHAMGFNYNGRLRPKELLLREDGSIELIRREERLSDYFATLDFAPKILS